MPEEAPLPPTISIPKTRQGRQQGGYPEVQAGGRISDATRGATAALRAWTWLQSHCGLYQVLYAPLRVCFQHEHAVLRDPVIM